MDNDTTRFDTHFKNVFSSALRECLALGFELPLIIVAVAVNGGLHALRFTAGETHLQPELLAEHNEPDAMMVLPINFIITDARGEAGRLVVAHPNDLINVPTVRH